MKIFGLERYFQSGRKTQYDFHIMKPKLLEPFILALSFLLGLVIAPTALTTAPSTYPYRLT
jgi:hypothetical protein